MTPKRTPTELIVHADGSSTIQAADPNPPRNALREREALERELRLDEERIADQMEAAELRGITAPDY